MPKSMRFARRLTVFIIMLKFRKIIFIDRDGVINVDPIGDYIKKWEDFIFEKGALQGLIEIRRKGYEIIIISNQAGIGDGVYPETELWNIHENMLKEFAKRRIEILAAHYCLHGKEHGCDCRKPKTGLFKKAVEGMRYEKEKTFMIGDKASDMEGAKKFGLKTIFVRTGHGKFDEAKLTDATRPDFIAENLLSAARFLP